MRVLDAVQHHEERRLVGRFGHLKQVLELGVGVRPELGGHTLVHPALGELGQPLSRDALHPHPGPLRKREHLARHPGRKDAFHEEQPLHLGRPCLECLQHRVNAVHHPLRARAPALFLGGRPAVSPAGLGGPVPRHSS